MHNSHKVSKRHQHQLHAYIKISSQSTQHESLKPYMKLSMVMVVKTGKNIKSKLIRLAKLQNKNLIERNKFKKKL